MVITTCSPRHFELVKALGADYVFDYKSGDVAKMINEVAPDLEYVFDTIGAASSSATASQAIRESGGVLCTVRPGKANTEDVTKRTKVTDVLVWTAFLKDHRYGDFFWPVCIQVNGMHEECRGTELLQANKSDHELAFELFRKLPNWLESGTIKPSVARVLKGLEAIPEGFQEYRDGQISGYKIVYEFEA